MNKLAPEAKFISRFTRSGGERGRPRNLYTKAESQWQSGGTLDWFGVASGIASLPPPSRLQSDIRWQAYGLIMQYQVPVLRRVLEATLVFDHGFTPRAVTTALRRLAENEYLGGKHIFCEGVRIGNTSYNLYSLKRAPTLSERGYLQRQCARLQEALPNETLGRAGELYARGLLIASGLYCNVTQKKRVGRIIDREGKNKLDLVATETSTGLTYGISVKNQREFIFGGHKAIRNCYSMANAHGVLPWLIVSFADRSAIERCARDGIRLTVLGRQIIPAKAPNGRQMRVVIQELRGVIGPRPFEFLHARFDRTLEFSSAAQDNLAVLRSLCSTPGLNDGTPTEKGLNTRHAPHPTKSRAASA